MNDQLSPTPDQIRDPAFRAKIQRKLARRLIWNTSLDILGFLVSLYLVTVFWGINNLLVGLFIGLALIQVAVYFVLSHPKWKLWLRLIKIDRRLRDLEAEIRRIL